MKNCIITWTSVVLLLTACQANAPRETSLSGTLTGLPNDTLLVSSRFVDDIKDEHMRTDIIVCQQGTFSLPIEKDSLPVRITLYPLKQKKQQEIEVVVLPGESVKVTGSVDSYQVKGSAFYQTYLDSEKLWQPYLDKIAQAEAQADSMQAAGVDRDSISNFRMAYYDYYQDMDEAILEYIHEHSGEDAALYLCYKRGITGHNGSPLHDLSDQVKGGPLAPLYQKLVQIGQEQENKKEVLKGENAPDFTLKDLQGHDFTLSSLRGKYVILDFWGSWCIWCIKGFPELKEHYAKYKDKLEVVAICCHDTEDRWRKAVERYKLPWVNVFDHNEHGEITRAYNVQHFPTKVLIDPEGKIVQVDFSYNLLNDLLGHRP
mgnify:CR=1 FL=1